MFGGRCWLLPGTKTVLSGSVRVRDPLGYVLTKTIDGPQSRIETRWMQVWDQLEWMINYGRQSQITS